MSVIRHVSLNIIIIVSNIWMKHLTSYKVWKRMDQQCSAIVKRWTISTSDHNSCHQPKSPWTNRLINDRLSVNQTLPQLTNISHRMFTNPLYSIAKILFSPGLKSDMLRSHKFGAMVKSGISRWSSLMVVRARCAGTLFCWKLSVFCAFDIIKNVRHVSDRKFTEVHVCQKLSQ